MVVEELDYCVLNNDKALEVIRLIGDGGKCVLNPGQVLVIQDQIIPPNSPEVSAAGQILAGFAQQQQTEYYYGIGMASHVLLDHYVKKGDVVVSADPDILMLGAKGAMGICLGAAKLAQAIVSGKVIIPQPDSFKVKLTGKLPDHIDIRAAAMMLVMKIKEHIGSASVVEFYQGADTKLTESEKAILCGWMQKTEALSALIVEKECTEPDYFMDLAEQKAVLPVKTEPQQEVRVVFIGGAYGGYLADIKQAAEQLNGKKIAYKVRLLVAPATSDIYAKAADKGYLTDIMKAGGMIINQCGNPAVQARIGEHEIMVSNDIHDEKGYAGPKSSNIYLATTCEAIQCALSGTTGGEVK